MAATKTEDELRTNARLSEEDIKRITEKCDEPLNPRDFHGRWVVPVYAEEGEAVVGSPSWEEGNMHIRWTDDVLFTFAGTGNEDQVRESFEFFRTFRG